MGHVKSEILKSRNFLDNIDQPTPTCVCQAEYKTAEKPWYTLKAKDNIDRNLVETMDDLRFRALVPRYRPLSPKWNYTDISSAWGLVQQVFYYANDEPCSCASDYVDSKFADTHFKMNFTMEANLMDFFFHRCDEKMTDTECNYHQRDHDKFDLSIENHQKDGCTVCYGIGPNLWLISEDKLIQTLTRSQGGDEDCKPKKGFHKSSRNEIYRCEQAEGLTGVIAFTEANGDTDYECGYYWHDFPKKVIVNFNAYGMNQVILVSFDLTGLDTSQFRLFGFIK